jgi:hypothetical protein
LARQNQTLGYYVNLERYPSLDPGQDVNVPELEVTDGNTVWSQRAQAYTQFVPLHDPDGALTINPMGLSERPDNPYRFSVYSDWSRGNLNSAPLSREKVDALRVEQKVLSAAPQPALSRSPRGERSAPRRPARPGN